MGNLVTNLFKGGNQSFFSEKEIHRRHPNQKMEEIEVSDDALATSTETSESKNGPPSRAFEGQLTLRMLTCRVQLKKDFADFMMDCPHETVFFSGTYRKILRCSLVKDNGRIKFGRGWRRFCRKSNFNCGDILRWECKDVYETGVIYVSKLEV